MLLTDVTILTCSPRKNSKKTRQLVFMTWYIMLKCYEEMEVGIEIMLSNPLAILARRDLKAVKVTTVENLRGAYIRTSWIHRDQARYWRNSRNDSERHDYLHGDCPEIRHIGQAGWIKAKIYALEEPDHTYRFGWLRHK